MHTNSCHTTRAEEQENDNSLLTPALTFRPDTRHEPASPVHAPTPPPTHLPHPPTVGAAATLPEPVRLPPLTPPNAYISLLSAALPAPNRHLHHFPRQRRLARGTLACLCCSGGGATPEMEVTVVRVCRPLRRGCTSNTRLRRGGRGGRKRTYARSRHEVRSVR